MTRTHARWITADTGALLLIEDAGTILANEAGADINRMARASVPRDEGRHFAEVLIYGDGPYTNAVSVGFAQPTASLSTYVGAETVSYGYRDGAIHNNGVAVQSGLTAIADGDIVGVELDLGSDPQQVVWYLNGAGIAVQSLGTSPGSGATWHLAVSLAGSDDGDLRAFLNSGQRAFQFPIAAADGWYSVPDPLPEIRLSTSPYLTASDDAPPHVAFESRIVDDGLNMRASVSFWPFSGRSRSSQSISEIRFLDPHGDYDFLLTADTRDVPVWIRMVDDDQPLSSATFVAQALVDRVEAVGDNEKVIHLTEIMGKLDTVLQRQYFLPNAEAGAANRPWPVPLGAVRNFEPVLVDEATNRWRIADAPISGLGDCRVEGVILDETAAPPEIVLTHDRQHVELDQPADGKFTVEVSTLGDAVTAGQTDLFAGIGDPFADTDSNDVPDGWTVGTNDPGSEPIMNATFPWVDFPTTYFNLSWMTPTTPLILTPGKTYTVETKFIEAPAGNVRPQFYIELHDDPRSVPVGGIHRRMASYALAQDKPFSTDDPVSITFSIPDTWPSDTTIPYLVYYGNNFQPPGSESTMEYVRIFELPDAFTASQLDGLPLEQFCTEVLTKRGQFPPALWSAADAAAIDAATGYEIGWYSGQEVSIRAALVQALDTYTAVMIADAQGVIRFVRLIDPALVPDVDVVGEISDHNLLSEVSIRPDEGQGLTNALHARRNWSPYEAADFGDTTFVEVTQATRRALSRDYQITRTSGGDFPALYNHAILGDPQASLLDRPDHTQSEIDRVAALYGQPRWLYTVTIAAPPGTAFAIGDVWRITYPRYDLGGGKKLMVVDYDYTPASETCDLKLWG